MTIKFVISSMIFIVLVVLFITLQTIDKELILETQSDQEFEETTLINDPIKSINNIMKDLVWECEK